MPSPISGQRAMYSSLRRWNNDLAPALFRVMLDRIRAGLLVLATGEDGTIPQALEARARSVVTNAVLPIFTAPSAQSPYPDKRAPFAADGVTAIAEYPRELNGEIARVTGAVVNGHYQYMKRNLPDDVLRWLQMPRRKQRCVSAQPASKLRGGAHVGRPKWIPAL
jgi:hypothetical protein